jgi:hypothetical protein
MDISTITTTAVNTWLRAVRLPLTTAERALRLDIDSAAWTPALWFEMFEANVRERAGRALRDPKLSEQARLQRAELALRRRADAKRAEAAAARAEAQAEFDERRRDLAEEERHRHRVEMEREAQLERERIRAQERVEEHAADRASAMEDAAKRRDRVVEATKRRASLEGLDAEEQALKEKEKAAQARAKALKLEDEAKRAKAARKNGG